MATGCVRTVQSARDLRATSLWPGTGWATRTSPTTGVSAGRGARADGLEDGGVMLAGQIEVAGTPATRRVAAIRSRHRVHRVGRRSGSRGVARHHERGQGKSRASCAALRGRCPVDREARRDRSLGPTRACGAPPGGVERGDGAYSACVLAGNPLRTPPLSHREPTARPPRGGKAADLGWNCRPRGPGGVTP